MRKFTAKRRIAVAVAVAAIVLAGGGSALAYFTAGGFGTGNGNVGGGGNWSVTLQSTSNAMYPGHGSSTVLFTVTNTGQGNQAVTIVIPSIPTYPLTSDAETAAGADILGCTAAWFTPTVSTSLPTASVAPGQSTTVAVVVTMTDSLTDQDACRGTSPAVTINLG